RAAKELLYIPLSYIARYRAKEVIDVFGYRFGKGGMSLIVVFIQQAGILLTSLYSVIAMVAAGIWLVLVFPMTKKPK
ncbi:MAG: Npt1/Npt2 family nucleotide transporter, partial [Deltaproteobacteria bacterium]|nr:Npt1/Npt2 family nucleotide transporter [Deltaproteobacteria bacterium]